MFLQKGWCGSPRSIKEVKTKLQMKQEGAIKRERAMVYALTHQVGQCVFRTEIQSVVANCNNVS